MRLKKVINHSPKLKVKQIKMKNNTNLKGQRKYSISFQIKILQANQNY